MPPKAQSPINIKRIYLKSSSFQAKNQPSILSQTEKYTHKLRPLQVSYRELLAASDCYEVSLVVKVDATMGDFDAYQIQLEQAVEVELKGYDEASKKHALEAICPDRLYQYATHHIADDVIKGGFPLFLLAPMNFEAIYKQHLAQQAQRRVQPSAAGIFAPAPVAGGAGGESEGEETFLDPGDLPADATRPG